MASFARNLMIGFAAATLLMAGSSFGIDGTARPDRPMRLAEVMIEGSWPVPGSETGGSGLAGSIAQPWDTETWIR